MATTLRLADMEGDARRYEAVIPVLLRTREALTEAVKIALGELEQGSIDTAKATLKGAITTAIEMEMELAKAASTQ